MGLADPFGEAAIERERGDRHDERRHLDPGNDEAIDEAGEAADRKREDDRDRQGKAEILPRIAEHDRAEAHHGADRKINSAGDDDESHRQRDEADFGHQPALIQQVVDGQKALVGGAEAGQRDHEDDREQRLMPLQPPGYRAGGRCGREAHFDHPLAARR